MSLKPVCPRCDGVGEVARPLVENQTVNVTCPRCFGTGLNEFREGFEEMGVEEE